MLSSYLFSNFSKKKTVIIRVKNASISLYKNGCTDVCLFVCMSVGMWRANQNPNPYTNLDEIFHAHPHLSKEGFGAGLTLGLGGLKP